MRESRSRWTRSARIVRASVRIAGLPAAAAECRGGPHCQHHQRQRLLGLDRTTPAADNMNCDGSFKFAADSSLEEDGFELTVPPERKAFPRALDRFRRPSVTRRQAWPHRATPARSVTKRFPFRIVEAARGEGDEVLPKHGVVLFPGTKSSTPPEQGFDGTSSSNPLSSSGESRANREGVGGRSSVGRRQRRPGHA
jgi:hypothetical protein